MYILNMVNGDEVQDSLYDAEGRPVGEGMPQKRRESMIFRGLVDFEGDELERSGEKYNDFVERFQGDYDLDDLMRDYGFGEILNESPNYEVELRESNEDMARYNLRAGVLTVEAEELGWSISYEQDHRIEADLDIGPEGYRPEWAEILSGDEEIVSREGGFSKEENISVRQEAHLPETLKNIVLADQALAEVSKPKKEFEITEKTL